MNSFSRRIWKLSDGKVSEKEGNEMAIVGLYNQMEEGGEEQHLGGFGGKEVGGRPAGRRAAMGGQRHVSRTIPRSVRTHPRCGSAGQGAAEPG